MTYYPLDKVTRIEIIDQKGRSYVNWDDNNKVELSFQDDEQTLKVFISRVNPDEREPHSLITKTLKNHYDELNEIADNVEELE
jgi:fibronectin type 3 domain-containing protein